MLYYITDEIVTAAENNNSKAIEVLENIARAHRYGIHFAISNRKILNRLIKIKSYENTKTKEIYKSILAKYSTYGRISEIITLKVVFILNKDPYIKKDQDDRYEEIGIPIENVEVNNLLKETMLLGENINEIEFYNFMSKLYQTKQISSICTNYHPLHGGGNTTKDVLKSEADLKRHFCLAFLDSDKKCHNGSYGETLKGVMTDRRAQKCFYTSDYIFSDRYREAENMIPLEVLRTISEHDVNWSTGVKDLECIQKKGSDFNFYDIKYGINEEKYSKIKKQPEKDYITQLILLARDISSDEIKDIENPSAERILLFGVGGDVLDRAIKYYKNNFNEWTKKNDLKPCLEQEWIRIGKEVLNWTCASSKIRA